MDLQAQVEEISSKAKFGDLIEFSYPIGYSHWGLYDEDGYVLHFGVTDETQLMNNFRITLQSAFPMAGDMLMGVTRVRRVPMGEVNLPKGVRVLISNNRHAFKPSSPEEMRRRFDALKDVELPYNFLFMNCEHFVTFVRYGKAICNQILTKPQNRETKSATRILRDIVDSKNPS